MHDPDLLYLLTLIKAAMPMCKNPEDWAEAFAEGFGHQPPADLPMFFAQIGHESSDLNRLEENLYYTTVDRLMAMFPRTLRGFGQRELTSLLRHPERLANTVYGNKLGNRGYGSGDGWRFRARGPLGITGRINYEDLADDTGLNVVDNPDSLSADKFAAAKSAVWFWRKNRLDDADTVAQATRKINGPAMAGLEDRDARYRKTVAVA